MKNVRIIITSGDIKMPLAPDADIDQNYSEIEFEVVPRVGEFLQLNDGVEIYMLKVQLVLYKFNTVTGKPEIQLYTRLVNENETLG